MTERPSRVPAWLPVFVGAVGLGSGGFACQGGSDTSSQATVAPVPVAQASFAATDHCDSPHEPFGATWGEREGALSSISCAVSNDTGYKDGKAFAIQVVTVDGKKVEIHTANAYMVMAKAAAAAGVNLSIVSGFRTMAEQTYFYNCYVKCNCNNCNLAAKPGYSNHQSGHALDLNTSAAGVFNWLSKNGGKYGFSKTVPSEAWHWEWWGGGPGGSTCPVGCTGSCDDKNVCTDDSCKSGKCVHTNNGIVCWDGNACTAGEKCSGGKCVGGKQKDCNDNNPCTADGCAGGTCSHGAQAGPCNDSDGCSVGEACAGGKCGGGKPKDCNDSNPCTADACKAGASSHAAAPGTCSDGNACTTGDQCAGGACGGKALACDDSLPCTADACNNGACTHSGAVQAPGKGCAGGQVAQFDACGSATVIGPCPALAACVAGVCVALPTPDAAVNGPDVGSDADADSAAGPDAMGEDSGADSAPATDLGAAEAPDLAGAGDAQDPPNGTADSGGPDVGRMDTDAGAGTGPEQGSGPGTSDAAGTGPGSGKVTGADGGGDAAPSAGAAVGDAGRSRAAPHAFSAAPAADAGCTVSAGPRRHAGPHPAAVVLALAAFGIGMVVRRRARP